LKTKNPVQRSNLEERRRRAKKGKEGQRRAKKGKDGQRTADR
jgi:hypothetical protein